MSAGFFRTLGVTPVLGRDFRDGEDLLAAPRTVILSYGAWQPRYGGAPDVLGKAVVLDGEATVIVGVLPRDFPSPPWSLPSSGRRFTPKATATTGGAAIGSTASAGSRTA